MSSLEDLLGDIVKKADGQVSEDDRGKIVKRITLTPAQKQIMQETKDSAKQAAELISKAETLRRKFWADIEIESGLYVNTMRYDEDQDVVIVYESPLDK